MIYNPAEFRHHGPAIRSLPFMVEIKYTCVTSLYKSGYSFDLMSLNDFLASKHKYKNVIFLNVFTVNKKIMQLLKQKVRGKGVTAFWTYAPGLVAESGFFEKNMEELTSIKLAARWEKLPLSIKLENNNKIQVGGRSKETPICLMSPRVYCIDNKVEVLGRYIDDHTAGLVRKRLPDGSIAIFTGVPFTNVTFWDWLLKDIDHSYVANGTVVRANSKLVMVHSKDSGTREVKLRKRANVIIDIFNKKIIAQNTDKFSFDDDLNTTSLFYYGDDAKELLEKLQALE